MVFRDILKGLKGEIEKRTRPGEQPTQEEAQPTRVAEGRRYLRLSAWLKQNYRSRFRDGSTTAEVQSQLENIFKELEARGDFRKNPKIVKGFRAYIDGKQYGDLVRVSQ